MNRVSLETTGQDLLNIPDLFIELLKKRGVEGEERVRKFLYPSMADLPEPKLMKGLVSAVELVADYIDRKRKIVIWGDYDVDGTTGTALLVNFFKELGVHAEYHIPNRLDEGYGLNLEWFEQKKNAGLTGEFLLITVDCGISNRDEIEAIKRLGGTVIVTDHHVIPEEGLPKCIILNPSQVSCGFNGMHLAGVGVAFYLAAGIRSCINNNRSINKSHKELNLKRYLAFVALGTLADMVQLTETNRILVRAGIEALLSTDFIGLQQLLTACEIGNGTIPSEDIGYALGPKINAAGRLGESRLVVDLLTTDDPALAKKMSNRLLDLNRQRRRITEENVETALSVVSRSAIDENRCVIVQGEMHKGVVGIVASRLVDLYGVPAIVFAINEDKAGNIFYTGSARSIAGINIIDLLSRASVWLEKFGGHEMAAGLTVSHANYKGFKDRISSLFQEAFSNRTVITRGRFDARCPVQVLMSDEYLQFLQLLEPFGPGNEMPMFEDPAAKVIDTRKVGRDMEHLQITIRTKYSQLKGIGFGLADRAHDIQQQPVRKIIYTPTINRFRGTQSWQVRVIDL
jgi:single-stranded-DNA-specific exonuclease